MIKGFKLFNIISETEQTTYDYLGGSLEYSPKIKYQHEKQNPIKPWIYWREGKYHADEFACKVPVTPTEYRAILNLLNTVEMADPVTGYGLYISFWQADQQLDFPITKILSYPKSSEDLQEYPDFIKFTLESRYESNPGLPAFTNYGANNYGSGLYSW